MTIAATRENVAIEPLVPVREAQPVLGASPATVYRLIHRGELEAIRVRHRLMVRPSELAAFIERNRVGRAA